MESKSIAHKAKKAEILTFVIFNIHAHSSFFFEFLKTLIKFGPNLWEGTAPNVEVACSLHNKHTYHYVIWFNW